MTLTKYERETAINYTEADKMATVYTFNRRLRTKLEKAAEEYPGECICKGESFDGGVTYLVPRNWVTINPPRKMTAEQRQVLSDRAKATFWSKGGDC